MWNLVYCCLKGDYMLGQKMLLSAISQQIRENVFPRFSIIVGDAGSEKNEVGKYISKELGANCIIVDDCKVDNIRDVIADSYRVKTITVYNIQNADVISAQARNALLKVTEEPPNKAYFVMTLEDENNTLGTIRSRGAIFHMEPYSNADLEVYCRARYNCFSDYIWDVASTPGDVDLLMQYGVDEFYSFVEKVIDHIATAGGSNAFKISNSIKLKDSDESGYDLRLFWKAFCCICFKRKYFRGLSLTSSYLSLLHIRSVNRLMIFDNWILEIRGEWVDGSC